MDETTAALARAASEALRRLEKLAKDPDSTFTFREPSCDCCTSDNVLDGFTHETSKNAEEACRLLREALDGPHPCEEKILGAVGLFLQIAHTVAVWEESGAHPNVRPWRDTAEALTRAVFDAV